MVVSVDSSTTRFVIGLVPILFFASLWLAIVAFLRTEKKKTPVYLLFFTIFYIYLFKVLDYTLLQFQSLLLVQHFVPNLMVKGVAAPESINLMPLVTLTGEDLRTSLLNILLMMPFGFGLPFITDYSFRRIVLTGVLFSVAIELLQLLTGLAAGMTFRIADINDVIFNSIGAAMGYLLFIGFMHIYLYISHKWELPPNSILQYIAERPQIDK